MRQDGRVGTGKDGMFEEGWGKGRKIRKVNETRWKGGDRKR
jgi:hypothetical protein